jgi:hypothetical protein
MPARYTYPGYMRVLGDRSLLRGSALWGCGTSALLHLCACTSLLCWIDMYSDSLCNPARVGEIVGISTPAPTISMWAFELAQIA